MYDPHLNGDSRFSRPHSERRGAGEPRAAHLARFALGRERGISSALARYNVQVAMPAPASGRRITCPLSR